MVARETLRAGKVARCYRVPDDDPRRIETMRNTISARYLLAAPPGPTIVPSGFVIQRYRARVAQGARKPRVGCISGATPSYLIAQSADRRVTRGLAARGW